MDIRFVLALIIAVLVVLYASTIIWLGFLALLIYIVVRFMPWRSIFGRR